MAIWQCDIQLIPNSFVNNSPHDVEIILDDEGFLDTTNWWSNHQPDKTWLHLIAQEFPVYKSWSDEILMWGKEEGILFQVCVTGSIIEEIGVRIDARHLDTDKIKKMIEVIKRLQCHIYFMETQAIIPPVYEEFIKNLKSSRAVAFVKDPRGCLENIDKDRRTEQEDTAL
jgi:hypothetical protein